MQVQSGHLGHLLSSQEMDGTVRVLCRPVNPYTVSSPNYTPPQLHDTQQTKKMEPGQQGCCQESRAFLWLPWRVRDSGRDVWDLSKKV